MTQRYDWYETHLGADIQTAAVVSEGFKSRGLDWRKQRGVDFTRLAGEQQRLVHIRDGADHTCHLPNPTEHEIGEGRKGARANAEWFDQNLCKLPSSSPRRRAASALIAKIPQPLALHITRTFYPNGQDNPA